MEKGILLDKIRIGVSEIHDEVFPDIEVDKICVNNVYVNKALEKYAEYFNYIENQEKYNLKYCFKSTLKDLDMIYNLQEDKINVMQENSELFAFEHEINEHIYEEVKQCQKKVSRIFFLNTFVSYLLAFLLIFGVTEIMHFVQLDALTSTAVLALLLSGMKLIIDKRYLEKIRNKVGWKSYRVAIRRSLAFYFASVIMLQHCQHVDISQLRKDKLAEFRSQVEESISTLLQLVLIQN